MTVKLVYRGKEYDVQEGMTVRDASKKVGLQPETILAVHGGKLLTDDTILKSDMKTIKLVAVISGGSPFPCSRSLRTGEGWGEGVQ
jgi:sulfur carrier protein ThiS